MSATVLAAAVATSAAQSQTQQRIAAFAARTSFEATRLAPGDIEALRTSLAPATPIYVSAVPARPPAEQVDTGGPPRRRRSSSRCRTSPRTALRAAPHSTAISAGSSATPACGCALVIGGDLQNPAGPFLRRPNWR